MSGVADPAVCEYGTGAGEGIGTARTKDRAVRGLFCVSEVAPFSCGFGLCLVCVKSSIPFWCRGPDSYSLCGAFFLGLRGDLVTYTMCQVGWSGPNRRPSSVRIQSLWSSALVITPSHAPGGYVNRTRIPRRAGTP